MNLKQSCCFSQENLAEVFLLASRRRYCKNMTPIKYMPIADFVHRIFIY